MHAHTDRDQFSPPRPPARLRAITLAVLVHVVLIGALTWGVNWKNTSDQPAVEAELWAAVPTQAAPRAVAPPSPPTPTPPPVPAAPPTPAPRAAPPPPAPPPVRVAPPPPPDTREADIAIEREKKRLEQEKKERTQQLEREKRERERARKEDERRDRLEQEKKERLQKDKQDKQEKAEREKTEREKERREKLEKAEKAEKAEQEKARKLADEKRKKADEARESKEAEARHQANVRRMQGLAGATGADNATGTGLRNAGPSGSYGGKVAAKVKPNIVYPDAISGNPRAEVEVKLSPDGTIVGKRLVQASGNKAWDDAVLRALDKTETLPRDVDGRVPGSLVIGFRPQD